MHVACIQLVPHIYMYIAHLTFKIQNKICFTSLKNMAYRKSLVKKKPIL